MSDVPREDEGFLQRWSRRKAGIATSADEVLPAVPEGAATSVSPTAVEPSPAAVAQPAAAPAVDAAAPPPEALPTFADVAALTPGADVARFMRPGVDGAVRRAALKKLFSDPRFNVMDGLDTYIDDYGKPDPLPLAMLRRMHQSATLRLFESESDGADAPDSTAIEGNARPDGAVAEAVAQSIPVFPPTVETETRAEDDPDLRLQPDDADRRPGAGAQPQR
jgi:hypothetical protein